MERVCVGISASFLFSLCPSLSLSAPTLRCFPQSAATHRSSKGAWPTEPVLLGVEEKQRALRGDPHELVRIKAEGVAAAEVMGRQQMTGYDEGQNS